LANSAQARKRARQATKCRAHNMSRRNTMRTAIKKVLKLIKQGSPEQAAQAYTEAVPLIDTMAGGGIIHKNKAARHKSRLNARIKAMQA